MNVFVRKEDQDYRPLGILATKGGSPNSRLVRAILGQLSGDTSAAAVYEDLLRAPGTSPDLKVVAATLAATALADMNDVDSTKRVLALALESTTEPIGRGILLNQWSLRLIEQDQISEAISLARECLEIVRESPSVSWRRTVEAVALGNLAHATLQSGNDLRNEFPRWLQRRIQAESVVATSWRLMDGLSAAQKRQFETLVSNPRRSSVTWRAQDPVLQPLLAGSLRSEVLGDWTSVHESRLLLGRYRVAEGLGRKSQDLQSGLDLLRRAKDREATQQAADAAWRYGPLPALRQVAVRLGDDLPSRPTDWAVILASTDVLPDEVAVRLWEKAATLPPQGLTKDVVQLALRLASGLGPTQQTAVAQRTRFWAREGLSPAALAAATSWIGAVDWVKVSEQEREAWLTWIGSDLGNESAMASLLGRVAVELSVANKSEVKRLLLARLGDTADLFLASLLTTTLGPGDAGWMVVLPIAVSAVDRMT